MDNSSQAADQRKPYEPPTLTTLASVEDATLSTPETVGSDAILALSTI